MNQENLTKQWRSQCPVACTLDLVGDRWSLLVVRDMLLGRSKFREFLASPENIPTNILSSRLKLLEQNGIIKATLYQRHPPRFAYTLTEKGEKLASVIAAIADWGESNIPNSLQRSRKSGKGLA
ncbi:MAG TPA: helix-turn-helix domain-containing protein [Chthoniobacterales bacterium]|nr:helix-turn-helix domain-containing protein [Chthoniobacterales bacterium]